MRKQRALVQLSESLRKWLIGRIARDVEHMESHGRGEIMAAFVHPRVWLLSLINVALIACSYGCVFFMPLIVSDLGFTKLQTGFITALPFLAAAIATIVWGRKSDRADERKLHLILPLLVAVAGFALAAEVDTVTVKMIGPGLVACGTFASLPPTFLRGRALQPVSR